MPERLPGLWESILAAGMAVWGWIILRSVRHGEKLAHIETKMVTLEQFDKFSAERRKAFERFCEEQQMLVDELRASMLASMKLQRRAQRQMHRQNERALRAILAAAKKEAQKK
jgi:hypothetical protein